MSFELYINGQKAALPADAKITENLVNQILDRQGSYSYPFELPYKPNAFIFGNIRLQQKDFPNNLPFELRASGQVIAKGETFIQDVVVNTSISVMLRNDSRNFWKQIENVYLDEFDFGGETNQSLDYDGVKQKWTDSCFKRYPDSPYTCAPIYAPNFFEAGTMQAFFLPGPYINDFDIATGKLKHPNIYCQHMYVRYVLDKLIENTGFTKNTDELDDLYGFNKLYMVSMNNMIGWFNIKYQRNLPHKKITDFLDALEKAFGIVLEFDDLLRKVNIRVRKTLVARKNGINRSAAKLKGEKSQNDGEVNGFTLKWADAGDSKLFQAFSTDLVTDVNTKADLPAPSSSYAGSSLYHVTSFDRYYACVLQEKANQDDPDVYLWEEIGTFAPEVVGDGSEDYSIPGTTLGNRVEVRQFDITEYDINGNPQTVTVTFNFQTPATDLKGNNGYDVFYGGVEKNDFPLIFMKQQFDIKQNVNSTDYHYPLSTFDDFTEDEQPLISGYNLKFRGSQGIYEVYLKDILQWTMTRKHALTYLLMSIHDLKQFKMAEKINIDGRNRVIKSLNVELSKSDTIIAELDNYVD